MLIKNALSTSNTDDTYQQEINRIKERFIPLYAYVKNMELPWKQTTAHYLIVF